jgi:hypothetical protein
MRAFIGASLLTSSVAQPKRKPFEIYDRQLPASRCECSRAVCGRTTHDSAEIVGSPSARWVPCFRMKPVRDVRKCCHRPAYWSQAVIGMSEPVDDRRNGATRGSAYRSQMS